MPPNNYENQQAAQDLLQGLNTMQMQAGFMPGAMPGMRPGSAQSLSPGPSPSDFSNNIKMQYTAAPWQHMTPPPSHMGAMSPVPRPMNPWITPKLPGSNMGYGYNQARQSGVGSDIGLLSGLGKAVGFGANMIGDTLAFAGGSLLGGLPGGLAASAAYSGSGLGSAIESMATAPFDLAVNQMRRSQQLQQMSTMHVNRGSQLSAAGTGLNLGASMQLERGLSSAVAGNGGTGFNRQDMMKMTQTAGQLGMLSDAQGSEDIKRSMVKISRAVQTFMKLAEEPDFRKAMESISRLRDVGFAMPQAEVAVRNARTFARMAGVTTDTMLGNALAEGAPLAQAMGMTGAAGVQMHMAAQGMAGMAASTMGPRQLALMGGREGMSQNMFNMNMQASNVDALLPSVLTMRNGKLQVDQEKLVAMQSGKIGLGESIRQSADNVGAMGMTGLQDLIAKDKGDLKDQLVRLLGPQAGMMAMYTQARAYSQETGLTTEASARALGANEQGARFIHEIGRNPEIFEGMRQQARQQMLEESRGEMGQRKITGGRAGSGDVMSRLYGGVFGVSERRARLDYGNVTSGIGNVIARQMQRSFGDLGDVEEQIEAQGGGDLIGFTRGDKLHSAVQTAGLKDRVREGRTGSLDFTKQLESARIADLERTTNMGGGITGGLAPLLFGRSGFGFNQAARGGTDAAAVMATTISEDLAMAGGRALAVPEKIRRLTSQQAMAGDIARAQQMTVDERVSQRDALVENKGRRLPVSGDKVIGAIGIGSKAYAKSLRKRYHWWRRNDVLDVPTTKQEMVQALVATKQYSEEEASKLVNDPAMYQQILASAQETLSEEERAVQDTSKGWGEQAADQERIENINTLQELSDESKRAALTHLGVNVRSATDEQQAAILDSISATGAMGEFQRSILKATALNAAGENDAALKMESELYKKGKALGMSREAITNQYVTQKNRLREDAGGDVLGRMGMEIVEAGGSYSAKEAAAAKKLEEDANYRLGIGLQNTLGAKGAEIYSKEGIGALRAAVEKGEAVGITGSAAKALADASFTDTDLRSMAAKHTAVETMARVKDGGTTAFGRSKTDVIDTLEEAAVKAGRDQDAERRNQNFGTAVSQFSQASDTLMKAAKKLTGDEDEGVRRLDDTHAKVTDPTGGSYGVPTPNPMFGG